MIGSTSSQDWLLLGQLGTGALWGNGRVCRVCSLTRRRIVAMMNSWHQYYCFSCFLLIWLHYPLTSCLDSFIYLLVQYILKKDRQIKEPQEERKPGFMLIVSHQYSCTGGYNFVLYFVYWYNIPTHWAPWMISVAPTTLVTPRPPVLPMI